jgi:hypothetical protein
LLPGPHFFIFIIIIYNTVHPLPVQYRKFPSICSLIILLELSCARVVIQEIESGARPGMEPLSARRIQGDGGGTPARRRDARRLGRRLPVPHWHLGRAERARGSVVL